jgi:carbonic anhydrase
MLPKKSKNIISVLLLSQIFFANHSVAKESESWSYVGRTGPDQWSKLDNAFTLCREGVTQSPINLDKKQLADDKDPLIFHYKPYKVASQDFSIKVSKESKRIVIGEKTYNLAQFHFHAPGEHSIDNKIYPVELHFVHQDNDRNLAVVGVMIKEGKPNPMLKSIIDTANKDNQVKYDVEDGDLMKLLPENKEYFHYMGSLTTPPCTEGVHWYVLKTPIEASKEELAALDKAMPDNARPIQESNNRVVK